LPDEIPVGSLHLSDKVKVKIRHRYPTIQIPIYTARERERERPLVTRSCLTKTIIELCEDHRSEVIST